MSNSEVHASAPDDREFYGSPPYPDMPAIAALVDTMEIESRREYILKWGVHPDFLPFAGLHKSPIEILIALRDLAEDKPRAASNIHVAEIAEELDLKNGRATGLSNVPITPLVHYLGGWEHPEGLTSHRGLRRWVNPNYKYDAETHETLGPLGSYADLRADNRNVNIAPEIVEARKEWVSTGLVLGLDGYQLARRMGVERHTVFSFCENHGIDSTALIDSGRELMLRTWRTAYEWGVPYSDLARASGYKQATLQTLMSRHIKGFEAPKDPTASGGNTNIY